MEGLFATRRSKRGEGVNRTGAVDVAVPVAVLVTVAVHVAHVTVAVEVACAGIADGISIAAVTGSRMVVLVGLGAAVAVPRVTGVTIRVLVPLDIDMVVRALVLMGWGVEDGTSVDSDTNVAALVGFGSVVSVGAGTTV